MPQLINPNNLSDEELVKLTLENQDNFLYLIKRYQDKLARYIRRMSGLNAEDTEDILQDVFIKIYQNINNFDNDLKFSSWVYRITHNEVIDNHRRRRARPQGITYDSENILNNIISDVDISREIDQKYLKVNLNKVLDKLDLKYREVLILKFLEEKEYKEISDILKKPMGTVATLISRAKKQFIGALKEENIKL